MKRLINLFILLSFLAIAGCGHYVATQPSPPVVMVPASPGPNYVWVSGAWRWNHGAYRWNDGYWASRRGGAAWVEGHWASTYRGYKYVPGHWR